MKTPAAADPVASPGHDGQQSLKLRDRSRRPILVADRGELRGATGGTGHHREIRHTRTFERLDQRGIEH